MEVMAGGAGGAGGARMLELREAAEAAGRRARALEGELDAARSAAELAASRQAAAQGNVQRLQAEVRCFENSCDSCRAEQLELFMFLWCRGRRPAAPPTAHLISVFVFGLRF